MEWYIWLIIGVALGVTLTYFYVKKELKTILDLLEENESFPEFYFEGNLYFKTIKNMEDLQELFNVYEREGMPKIVLLNQAKSSSHPFPSFGFYAEYNDSTTLHEFLNQHNIKI